METTFKPGDICYLIDGQECEYQTGDRNTHVVRPVIDTGEGDDLGRPFVVEKVYATAPTAKYEQRIAELEARRLELAQEVRELEERTRHAALRHNQRMTELKAYDQLRDVEAFMRGEISHVVTWTEYQPGKVSIIPFDEAVKDGRDLKLLCLFGTRDRRIAWKLNRYSDGSGIWSMVMPCTSAEQALEAAKAQVADVLASHNASTDRRPWTWDDALACAAKLGVPVPAGMVEERNAYRLDAFRCNVQKAEEKLAEAQKNLADAVATAASPN